MNASGRWRGEVAILDGRGISELGRDALPLCENADHY